jgi:hypothetical protein
MNYKIFCCIASLLFLVPAHGHFEQLAKILANIKTTIGDTAPDLIDKHASLIAGIMGTPIFASLTYCTRKYAQENQKKVDSWDPKSGHNIYKYLYRTKALTQKTLCIFSGIATCTCAYGLAREAAQIRLPIRRFYYDCKDYFVSNKMASQNRLGPNNEWMRNFMNQWRTLAHAIFELAHQSPRL